MGAIYTCENSRTITLPQCLADWIDKNMPDLKGGVASVTINCCDNLYVGFLFFKSRQGGFTSGPDTINITGCKNPIDVCDYDFVETILHELVHVLQWRRHPNTFTPRYFWRLVRTGFRAGRGSGHRDEENAYKIGRGLAARYKEEDPCHCNESDEDEKFYGPGDFPTPDERYGRGVRPA